MHAYNVTHAQYFCVIVTDDWKIFWLSLVYDKYFGNHIVRLDDKSSSTLMCALQYNGHKSMNSSYIIVMQMILIHWNLKNSA